MKEKFNLDYRQVILDDEQINIILFPSNLYLRDKIEVAEVISSKIDILTQLNDLNDIHRPLMFEKIQEMENIPQYVKDNIEL